MIPVFPEAGIEVADLACAVAEQTGAGARFAGLFAAGCPDGSILISAVLAWPGRLGVLEVSLAPGELAYPALTPKVPGATWYERELHDLFGLEPLGHPRLDALVLPLQNGALRPMPGMKDGPARLEAGEEPLPFHVIGEGLFTIPYGPVRSGVFESVQYLVETPGEEIPHLRTRVYHKHRGLARRFEAMSIDDGVLLAERVEGTTSVAQAWAFSQAVESIGASEVPPRASLLRLVHAELERLANHLDSMIRHCEGSGQAVAYARLSLHKERVLRLQARLCGHRFGRGVVVPGGVAGAPLLGVKAALSEVLTLRRGLRGDLTLLMETPSFLDRLRTAGRLASDVARAHGALGPIGRASGLAEDARQSRPYGPYDLLGFEPAAVRSAGDALARQQVRLEEVSESLRLVCGALEALDDMGEGPWQVPLEVPDGFALGSVEAPQGELLYLIEVEGGRLVRGRARCPSFHNLALLPMAFNGDIYTDFVFIEASFALSMAGVSR